MGGRLLPLQLAEEGSGDERRAAFMAATRACRSAVGVARVAREAQPGALRVSGTYYWLKESPERAQRLWADGAAAAVSLGAPFEGALIDMERGRRLGREGLVRHAEDTFRRLGCERLLQTQ